jgi:hypothetical protein
VESSTFTGGKPITVLEAVRLLLVAAMLLLVPVRLLLALVRLTQAE